MPSGMNRMFRSRSVTVNGAHDLIFPTNHDENQSAIHQPLTSLFVPKPASRVISVSYLHFQIHAEKPSWYSSSKRQEVSVLCVSPVL